MIVTMAVFRGNILLTKNVEDICGSDYEWAEYIIATKFGVEVSHHEW